MNFTLQVGPNWASQISAIRNKVTEDTNLIRFDNTFYRVCRDSDEQFAITLLPQDTQQRSLLLHLSMRNLYVNLIGGHGMSPELPIAAFDRLVKNWANTSDAIFNALSDEAKSIALQPRASLSPEQRQFSESVRPSTVHPDYQNFAQAVTVLNRPTRK